MMVRWVINVWIPLYYYLNTSISDIRCITLGSALKKHIHKLQVLQNKTVRKITNVKYNDPVKPIYNELGISTLDNLYKTELCKLMYLNSNKALPKPIISLYTSNTEIHNHNTRHKRDVHNVSRADDHN